MRRAETRDEGPTTVGDELLSAFKVASFKTAFEEDLEPINQSNDNDDESKDWVNIFSFLIYFWINILNVSISLLYILLHMNFNILLHVLGRNHSGEFSKEGGRGGKVERNGGSLSTTEKSENSSATQSERRYF